MTIQKTEFPDTKLTTNERFQLAAGVAVNDALEAACRFGQRIRSLGR